MANQVFLGDDGFIHNIHVGEQTKESVSAMVKKIASLAKQLRAHNQPVHILIYLTNLCKHTTGAREAAVEGIKNVDYDRAAAFSSEPLTRYVANLVIRASGKADKFTYCSSEADALAFLQRGRPLE